MHLSNSLILVVVNVCMFDLTNAGEVPLYYRTREVSNEFLESYFRITDLTITDQETLLSQYPNSEHVGCQSRFDCGFKCNLDNDCNFLVYNEIDATCTTYKLDGIAVVDNALHQCLSGYTFYGETQTKFCMRQESRSLTKEEAVSTCESYQGQLVVLKEDDKNQIAAQLAVAAYIDYYKMVWNSAIMDTETKTWFWPDGTPVDESRFDQTMQYFHSRPTSKQCVAFLGVKYSIEDCTWVGYALCETPLVKL